MYCDIPVLQRCCFCMPLRRGVLIIAYLKILFSAFMIGIYSYAVHHDYSTELMYNGTTARLPEELCVLIYCIECVFSAILIYGTHKKLILLLRITYYYTISTILMTVLIQIIQVATIPYLFLIIEVILFSLTGFFMQGYLIVLLWSLLKKWELDGPHVYDNQLHQFINGQAKDANGVYNPSTEPVEV